MEFHKALFSIFNLYLLYWETQSGFQASGFMTVQRDLNKNIIDNMCLNKEKPYEAFDVTRSYLYFYREFRNIIGFPFL